MASKSRRHSVGGVVAELFCGLRKPTRFSGGVVAEFVRGLRKPTRFSGGVVAEFFRGLQKPAPFGGGGGSTMDFPLMGPFYIFKLFPPGPHFGHCFHVNDLYFCSQYGF